MVHGAGSLMVLLASIQFIEHVVIMHNFRKWTITQPTGSQFRLFKQD